jgi:anti-anti-sigma factor
MITGSSEFPRWGLAGDIVVAREGGQLVLRLVGEIDQGVVEEFERRLDATPPIVDLVDASATTFFGCAGVQLLLRVRGISAMFGRAAVLKAASPQVERVLTLVGLADDFWRPATAREQ